MQKTVKESKDSKDMNDDKYDELVVVEAPAQPFVYEYPNRVISGRGDGTFKTILNADGFWTTSTSAAMSTTMTLLPAGDNMWASCIKLFEMVHFDKVHVTLDFTEYESLLERSTSTASARAFVAAYAPMDNASRDYYYLQDRPRTRVISPSAAKRVFRFAHKIPGATNTDLVTPMVQMKGGWYSTMNLATISSSNWCVGWMHMASSDTCGVAGIIRVRAQIYVTFKSRFGST